MSALGELLHKTRTRKNIDFDTVTEHTRISEEVLLKIEAGEFDKLPSYVHARNFVKAYSNFLKLDPEEVEPLFNAECSKDSYEREIHYISSPVTHEPIERKSPVGIIAAAVAVVIVLIAGAYFFASMKNNGALEATKIENSEGSVDTIQNILDSEPKAVIPQAEPVDNTSATIGISTVESPDAVANNEPEKQKTTSVAQKVSEPVAKNAPKAPATTNTKSAVLSFNDVCWVNIETDSGVVYDFIAEKGIERTVEFNEFFILNLGNASAATVYDKATSYSGFGDYRKPVRNLKFSYNDVGKLIYKKQN